MQRSYTYEEFADYRIKLLTDDSELTKFLKYNHIDRLFAVNNISDKCTLLSLFIYYPFANKLVKKLLELGADTSYCDSYVLHTAITRQDYAVLSAIVRCCTPRQLQFRIYPRQISSIRLKTIIGIVGEAAMHPHNIFNCLMDLIGTSSCKMCVEYTFAFDAFIWYF